MPNIILYLEFFSDQELATPTGNLWLVPGDYDTMRANDIPPVLWFENAAYCRAFLVR